ncbi:hypothetical protein GCM10023203_37850 [Actinomycetospora straminea]|uniref:Uncharacterized protein n=1 Tax=Actinomycetospora straminea TaxID=663607 RepID=A0ABP9EPM4_9PSEU
MHRAPLETKSSPIIPAVDVGAQRLRPEAAYTARIPSSPGRGHSRVASKQWGPSCSWASFYAGFTGLESAATCEPYGSPRRRTYEGFNA